MSVKLDYLLMSEEGRQAYDGYLAYLGQELGILDSAKEEKAIEIAKELINMGLSEEQVQQATKLPLIIIQKLEK